MKNQIKKIGSIIVLILTSTVVKSQSLSDDLLIHYPFNGNGNDVSGNGYHGDVHATLTTDPFGNPNSAYHFNGIDEYIDLPMVMALKPDLPVSYSFWIRLEDTAPQKTVFVTNDFAQNNHSGVWMNMSSTGVLAINFGDAGGNTTNTELRNYKGSTLLTTGVWYHVVGIANGPMDMKLYVDCVEEIGVYSGAGGSLQYTSASGSIGRKDVATVAPYYFQGSMDDFRYWNRALTDAEVQMLCKETVSAEELTVNGTMKVFPNPIAGDVLTISQTDPSIRKMRIVSSMGQLIFEGDYQEMIDCSEMPAGLYFIEFYDENGLSLGVQKLQRI